MGMTRLSDLSDDLPRLPYGFRTKSSVAHRPSTTFARARAIDVSADHLFMNRYGSVGEAERNFCFRHVLFSLP
jgi:hypothetical protein